MTAIRATLVIPESDTCCRIVPAGILKLSPTGNIVHLGSSGDSGIHSGTSESLIDRSDCLLLPGFYDLHFHWVQDRVRLKPKDSLLSWLKTQTFPEEARFSELEYARTAANDFWPQTAARGLVGGLVYSSIHQCALDEAMRQAGNTFRIGGVLMTRQAPAKLTQRPDAAIAAVREGLARYGDRYVISPRFALTTDPATLRRAGRLAMESGSFIQTHLSETPAEIETTLRLYRSESNFADVASCTEIYDRCGLLGPRSVFGHGIHLSPAERQRLADSGSIIAHCPTSNAPIDYLGLGSGLFDFRAADQAGLRWGLASDIGGGPFLNPFDVMHAFVMLNRKAGIGCATYVRALYRATIVNADLLDFDGRLQPGSPATFVLVKKPSGLSDSNAANPERLLSALLAPLEHQRAAGETLVEETWVGGRCVFRRGG